MSYLWVLLVCASSCPMGEVLHEISRDLAPVRIVFVFPGDSAPGKLVVAKISSCFGNAPSGSGNTLGWTAKQDGKILPEVFADCVQVRDFLGDSRYLGQALGRVLAHEIFHAVTKRESHTLGLNSRAFSREDLEGPGLILAPGDLKLFTSSLHQICK